MQHCHKSGVCADRRPVTRVDQPLGHHPRTADAGDVADFQVTPHRGPVDATTGQNVRVITTWEVAYFQADTKYTRVVTVDGEALVRMSLHQLQEQLDPSTFWPVHRSTIVNANAIASVARDFRGHVFQLLKQRPGRLAVSEPYHHLFRQMWVRSGPARPGRTCAATNPDSTLSSHHFDVHGGRRWDNVKKYIEADNFGGKGSETHKACRDPPIKIINIVALLTVPLL